MTAHPRVGGENSRSSRARISPGGSSPRGRGKRRRGHPAQPVHRLIPAWAGKTSRHACRSCPTSAHPRVGGENGIRACTPTRFRGLIPAWAGKTSGIIAAYMRSEAHPRVGGENVPLGRGIARGIRLIPAWAGKRATPRQCLDASTAHPRVGGENEPGDRVGHCLAGSSPRGRGKLDRFGIVAGNRRLIPAWAGKTVDEAC